MQLDLIVAASANSFLGENATAHREKGRPIEETHRIGNWSRTSRPEKPRNC